MDPKLNKPFKIGDYINLGEIIRHPANYSVVLTNLVMLIGLIFLGWSGQLIVAAYFLETIIVGLFNVIKMSLIWRFNPHPDDPEDKGIKGFAVIPFFMFHFGFFIVVQLVVFLGFSSALDPTLRAANSNFSINLTNYFQYALGDSFWIIVGNFVVGQVIYLTTVFLYRKEYVTKTLGKQMMQPYSRIVVQQFTVIISGFFLIVFRSSFVVPLLLIAFKTIADVVVLQWELKNGAVGVNPFNPTSSRF